VSPWRLIADALGQRLDADLIPTVYAAASLPTAEVREQFRVAGIAFVDEDAGQFPDAEELARSVVVVSKEAARTAAAVGAVGGAAGLLALGPEMGAQLVASLRLAQRLAVVYGFDPETDHGKLVLARALAAAWEVQLPESARVTTRLSDLTVVARTGGNQQALIGWAGRQVASKSAGALLRRVLRIVPGLGAGVGGVSAWRRQQLHAQRMADVFGRALESTPFDLGDEALAIEVRSSR
jgi:hypothetical protein